MSTSRNKRPPSSNPATTASSTVPSSSSSSSTTTAAGGISKNNGSNSAAVPSPAIAITGIDALLAKYARQLLSNGNGGGGGGTITVQLIKGPNSSSVDPIAARRAAALHAKRMTASSETNTTTASRMLYSNNSSSGADETSDGGGSSSGRDSSTLGAAAAVATTVVELKFPRLAKFVDTVTQPNFNTILKDGRMYEEEVPKAKDESDEDESTAYKQSNDNGGTLNSGVSTNQKVPSKKKRWRRNDSRPRRWILQEKSEFFDRIRKRKQRSSTPGGGGGGDDDDDGPTISNQYHGVVESNTSKYVILSVAPMDNNVTTNNNTKINRNGGSNMIATEKISVQSIHGFHTFSQPYKFASLTMEEAEDVIERKRDVMTRYMMHGRLASAGGAAGGAALVDAAAAVSRGRPILGPPPKAMSRARLLGKLAGGGDIGGFGKDDDGDDVMGDVRYSSSGGNRGRGGTASKARKELLSTLGDEGVTVDDDGVFGGANDDEFGGRGRFKRVTIQSANDNGDALADGSGGVGSGAKTTSTGFEAGAMEEGFYQRDVAAEYEALDYDANEQFDDDDVNVGEDEMMDDGGGYGGDFHDSGGDDGAFDSDDDEGAWSDSDDLGMATKSGLKAMLAKARGESPLAVDNSEAMDSANSSIASGGGGGGEGIDNLVNAAKKTAEKLLSSSSEDKKSSSASASNTAEVTIAVDKDGKRLITLEAIRREIWVNNGNITSKKLTRLFDVGKKNPERQALFKRIVMELCTIKKDADGNKLVLKQHYSKMQRGRERS